MKSNSFNSEKIANYIVNWLEEYAKNAGVKGFVIGISGGIDSAVVSTLCAKTTLPLLCVEMPIHQPESHVARGKEHIHFLKNNFSNVSSIVADLTPTFETFKQAVPSAPDTTALNLTLANTRARLRMTTLYYFSGIHQALVVGTGNKIEDFGVGFFTKYGDGGVDLSPIADLMKSEVWALGTYLNVCESILLAKPADGLFEDDRSDQDQLGASYEELEVAMLAFENPEKRSTFTTREKEVFAIYVRLNSINQHKIKPIPFCKIER